MQSRVRATALAVAVLTGCATAPPVPTAPTVVHADVAVPVRCVDAVPARPELVSEKTWAILPTDEHARLIALEVDRVRLTNHVEKLESILAGCADAPPVAAGNAARTR